MFGEIERAGTETRVRTSHDHTTCVVFDTMAERETASRVCTASPAPSLDVGVSPGASTTSRRSRGSSTPPPWWDRLSGISGRSMQGGSTARPGSSEESFAETGSNMGSSEKDLSKARSRCIKHQAGGNSSPRKVALIRKIFAEARSKHTKRETYVDRLEYAGAIWKPHNPREIMREAFVDVLGAVKSCCRMHKLTCRKDDKEQAVGERPCGRRRFRRGLEHPLFPAASAPVIVVSESETTEAQSFQGRDDPKHSFVVGRNRDRWHSLTASKANTAMGRVERERQAEKVALQQGQTEQPDIEHNSIAIATPVPCTSRTSSECWDPAASIVVRSISMQPPLSPSSKASILGRSRPEVRSASLSHATDMIKTPSGKQTQAVSQGSARAAVLQSRRARGGTLVSLRSY